MKGTHCGRRATALAVLLASCAAIAPSIASAATVDAAVPAAVTSTPTAPAVPVPAAAPAVPVSVPAPATPSLSAPIVTPAAPAAPVAAVAPAVSKVAAVAKPAATSKVTAAAKKIVARVTKPAAKATVASTVKLTTPVAKANVSAKAAVTKSKASAVLKAKGGVVSTSPVKLTKNGMEISLQSSVVFKGNTGWRKLANNYGDDPMGGCKSGVYVTCTSGPPVDIDNRCYGTEAGDTPAPLGSSSGSISNGDTYPVSGELVHFSQGQSTLWTKTEPVYKNGVLVGTRVWMRRFSVGFQGVGFESHAIYKLGTDVQKTWQFFLPVDPTMPAAQDQWTWDMLIVSPQQPPATPMPPNMWYVEHFVVSPTKIDISWHIVCQKYQKPQNDCDRGRDHDRSGDQDKYRHNEQRYHGYNDDDDGSWDQDD
jgi:hypothetical protein